MSPSHTAQLEVDSAHTISATGLRCAPVECAGVIPSSILVADDNANLLEAIAAMLEWLGHTVTRARDGLSAWDFLSRGQRFELLLTDVDMPHMSGLDLLAAARQARLGTPVVVISGDSGNRPLALQAGALAFLSKPFRMGELEAMVAGALSSPPRGSPLQDPL